MRGNNIRMISARFATKYERKKYEEGIWISLCPSSAYYPRRS
jgi:hypothetical protein